MMSVGTPNCRPPLEAVDVTDIMQEWGRRQARTAWWMTGWDRAWSEHIRQRVDAEYSLWPFGRKHAVRVESLLILRSKTRWFKACRRAKYDAIGMGAAIRDRQEDRP